MSRAFRICGWFIWYSIFHKIRLRRTVSIDFKSNLFYEITYKVKRSSWGISSRYLGIRTPRVNCRTSSQNFVELCFLTSKDKGLEKKEGENKNINVLYRQAQRSCQGANIYYGKEWSLDFSTFVVCTLYCKILTGSQRARKFKKVQAKKLMK